MVSAGYVRYLGKDSREKDGKVYYNVLLMQGADAFKFGTSYDVYKVCEKFSGYEDCMVEFQIGEFNGNKRVNVSKIQLKN